MKLQNQMALLSLEACVLTEPCNSFSRSSAKSFSLCVCVGGARVVAVQRIGCKQVVLGQLMTPTFVSIVVVFDNESSRNFIRALTFLVF
jgi:hypothetical protein